MMKSLFLIAVLLLLAPAAWAAPQATLSVQVVTSQGNSGCTPTGDNTILPTPPQGFCWQKTFDDSFQGSDYNHTTWRSYGINTSDGTACTQAGAKVDGHGTLYLYAGNISGTLGNSVDCWNDFVYRVPTNGANSGMRYGFFVWELAFPQGIYPDAEMDPHLFDACYAWPSYCSSAMQTAGMGEMLTYCYYEYCSNAGNNDVTSLSFYVRDVPGCGSCQDDTVIGIGNPTDLSQTFHQYGWYLGSPSMTGTTYGTVLPTYDGAPAGGAPSSGYTLQEEPWPDGVIFENYFSCGFVCSGTAFAADNFRVHFARAYQLVPQ